MRLRDKICYGLSALILLLVFFMFVLGNVCASEQEIGFEILERGDCSGYSEEAYIVVKTESEWITIWERHTLIRVPQESPPYIDFSRSFVVCTFMGRCPTTGYFIDIERVWTDGEHVFVKVTKHGPPEGFLTNPMITCPYIMILMEKVDMPFVFCVVGEDGETREHILTEYPQNFFSSVLFIFLLLVAVALIVRKFR